MYDMSFIWVVVGVGLLFSALVVALKIGLWVWIATRFLGQHPQQYQDAPIARTGSAANGFKKWLTIIATILGIISTTVGLLEKCSGSEPATRSNQTYSHPCWGTGAAPVWGLAR